MVGGGGGGGVCKLTESDSKWPENFIFFVCFFY